MIEKLKIKMIYDDFVKSVFLTRQIKILNMLLNKDSIIKISMEMGMSERTIGYEVKKIKNLYKDYYDLQISKLILFIK